MVNFFITWLRMSKYCRLNDSWKCFNTSFCWTYGCGKTILNIEKWKRKCWFYNSIRYSIWYLTFFCPVITGTSIKRRCEGITSIQLLQHWINFCMTKKRNTFLHVKKSIEILTQLTSIFFFFAFHWGFSRMINKIESHVYDLRRKKIALARKGIKSK